MTTSHATATPIEGEFRFPATSNVVYGPNALHRLSDLVERHGSRRAFAITSQYLDDVDAQLKGLLGGRYAGHFAGTKMHVPRESVLEAAAAARDAGADLILSLGGGTNIDCAKAVTLALAYDIRDRDGFDDYHVRFEYPDKLHVPAVTAELLPHVSVPTTLSGAESTNLFGVTDSKRRVKDAYSNPKFVVSSIIFDPVFSAGTPGWLWAASGVRALDHAIEGILSRRHMPMADALGLEGLRILTTRLRDGASDPSDLAARTDAQIGAWLCIYALTNVGVGLSHGIGHQLAAEFDMLHGVTSACMLPHVMEFNRGHTAPRLRRIADAVGVDVGEMSDDEAAVAAVAAVRGFIASLEPLGVPHTLKDAGAVRDRLPAVAEHALGDSSVAANPRPVSRDDLLGLLTAAWS